MKRLLTIENKTIKAKGWAMRIYGYRGGAMRGLVAKWAGSCED